MSNAERLGFDLERLARARQVLVQHVSGHTTPGGVGMVVRREGTAAQWAVGRHTYDASAREVRPDDLYDLASLTKVVVTTTLCMVLEEAGRLDLDAPVGERISAFTGKGRDQVTARHLLAHCGGLPAHRHFYRTCRSKTEVLEAICGVALAYEPGKETVYSDLGFLLLGALVEQASGERLERLAQRLIFDPVGMEETVYRPGADLLARIPPTEYDRAWRDRLVHGEVHDENAAEMGGVAPHAGLFGTADDLGRFLRLFLCEGRWEGRRIFSMARIRRFTSRAGIVPGSTRALGWDTVSDEGSSAGRFFLPRSYGHLGFTGTSMWADPERNLGVVLLTNRVHPTRENQGIRALRPAFHDAVSGALTENGS